MSAIKPGLSVALPVYNGANYLAEALDSISAQSFGDFEVVVADNCSSDDTPKIIARHAAKDARIRHCRSENFLSQVDNMNRAVGLCSAGWVKLFCHDDLMAANCLETIHAALSRPDIARVGLIGNAERYLFENGVTGLAKILPPGTSSRIAGRDALDAYFSHKGPAVAIPSVTSATVRKEAFEAMGGFDPRFMLFDLFLWMNLLTRWDYIQIGDVLTTNRIHGAQVAVTANRELRYIEDHCVFVPEFIRDHGSELRLSRLAMIRLRMRPVNAASTNIADALIKARLGVAARIIAKLPAAWLPLLPFLVARRLVLERKKSKQLSGVPFELIHPD
jgi:hypothetical protein